MKDPMAEYVKSNDEDDMDNNDADISDGIEEEEERIRHTVPLVSKLWNAFDNQDRDNSSFDTKSSIGNESIANDGQVRPRKFRVIGTSTTDLTRLNDLEDVPRTDSLVKQKSGLLTELAALDQSENVDNVSERENAINFIYLGASLFLLHITTCL